MSVTATSSAVIDQPDSLEKTLSQLQVGQRGYIQKIEGPEAFRQRIQEMGLVPGEEIYVERIAPLGDPIVIRIQGYLLGLRKEEAQLIYLSDELSADENPQLMADPLHSQKGTIPGIMALVGNPNSGKTSLFNGLTGLHQRVGNYPGITVEKREGAFQLDGDEIIQLLDLPGTYSMGATSPEEKIAVDILNNQAIGVEPVEGVIIAMDANNLARNLLLFTQVADLGLPIIVALTMCDMALRRGRPVNTEKLEQYLGVPVIPMNAKKKQGFTELKKALHHIRKPSSGQWHSPNESSDHNDVNIRARYRWISSVVNDVVGKQDALLTFSDRLDKLLVHRVAGLAFFAAIMTTVFFIIYTLADPLMGMVEDGVGNLGNFLFSSMNEGALKSLLLDGIVGGVGGVLVFIPQIALLFLCIALLEESGYLARAAFLLDRVLAAFGLHGKSFIPMLSSHACAIPGIMAARTIESDRDRKVTMFVAPFMSCGARLPVYTLLIGVFLAPYGAAVQSFALMACYLTGIFAAILVAWALRKTALREPPAAFLLELPLYQSPQLLQVFRVVFRNSMLFVKKAT
ncbi:MAG: fused ferrous iron transport protein A/B, partial [Planctomycetes bacterium]|nr:fused ferrous iron transport protein A/B [Planctomycetota bacterium]